MVAVTTAIDSVRADVHSAAPSAQTLRHLRAILGFDKLNDCATSQSHVAKPVRAQKASKSHPSTTYPAKRSRNARSNSRVAEPTEKLDAQIGLEDRRKLATEIFNTTLKQLGQAAKTEKEANRSRIENNTLVYHEPSQRPLQERSPNKEKTSSLQVVKRDACRVQVEDWAPTADCAHLSLRYLREDSTVPVGKSIDQSTGLDNAALILLDRTITLNLLSQAESQAGDIVQKYWKSRTGTNSKPNLPDYLLGRADSADNPSIFGFTTSMQSQMLRLIILMGPSGINRELVTSLKLETIGSPAWICLQGLQKKRQSTQATGLQLRTISLAIFKLYSIASKPKSLPCPPDALFELYGVAMSIKFASWEHLRHTPEPESEVWRHYLGALKRYITTCNQTYAAGQLAVCSIRSIQGLLQALGQDRIVPPDVLETFLRSAPQFQCETNIELLVEESTASLDSVTSLIAKCQITSSRLSRYASDIKTALIAVAEIRALFSHGLRLQFSDLERVLFHAAHLRKALMQVILNIEQSQRKGKLDESSLDLQKSSIQLTCDFTEILFQQMKSALSGKSFRIENGRAQVFLAFLIKNADTLLNIEKCSMSRTSAVNMQCHDLLNCCSDMIAFIQSQAISSNCDETILAATNQLQVRLSQAYWTRYLKAIEDRKGIEEQLQILNASVKGLTSLPMTEQISSCLGLKYQRLASCYIDLHDYKSSRSMARHAIELDIKAGSLSQATELALSGPSSLVWSQHDTGCASLGKSLDMYATASLTATSFAGNDNIFFDCRTLPPTHRAVMLERQICSLLERNLGEQQLLQCASQLKFLLQIVDKPEYRVYRLRLVNCLLNFMFKKRLPILGVLLDAQQIQIAVSPNENMAKDPYLTKYEPGLRIILGMQYDILAGQLSGSKLEDYLRGLRDILLQCQTADDLRNVIDNPEELIILLNLCVGYANMLENTSASRIALELMLAIMDHGYHSPNASKVGVLVQIGQLQMRLQNLAATGAALHAAKKALASEAADALTEIEWALAYAEYFHDLQDLDRCAHYLNQAVDIWEGRKKPNISTSRIRLREQVLLCTAAHITSKLSFQQGNLLQAAIRARQSVKVITAVWASISNVWISADTANANDQGDSTMHNLIVEFSNLDLSFTQHTGRWDLSAAIYWEHISLYCSTFSNIAFLTAHCGLYADAAYFYEQTLKVAKQANLNTVVASVQSDLALLHARAGQLDKSRTLLQELPQIPRCCDAPLARTLCAINQAEAHLLIGNISLACQSLQDVRFNDMTATKQESVSKVKSKSSGNSNRPSAKRAVPKLVKDATNAGQQLIKPPTRSLEVTMVWRAINARITALLSDLRMQKNLEVAKALSNATNDNSVEDPRKLSSEALGFVHSALRLFSEDAVNNVLAETAVALPVRYKSSRKSGRISFIQGNAPQIPRNKPASQKGKVSGANLGINNRPDDGRALLLKAHQNLIKVKAINESHVPSDVVHAVHRTLSQVTLLSTALGDSLVTSSVQLLTNALSPLDHIRRREATITSSEIATAEGGAVSEWPQANSFESQNETAAEHYDLDNLDLLPSTWSVVSIGVTEDRSELLVARISRNRSPFVLRIPLTRPDPSAMDNEELDFDSAKAELENIVNEANVSAHDSRGCSIDKSVRKAWFAERQSLDSRLAALLDNIENIWFGGFRGLLTASHAQDKALAKFGQKLSLTLNRHLPSRQKSSKAGEAVKIELHSHVLELFATLGHPREGDLEDSVTDLIYFVIDILQFNGESNAYDEIDFDAIVIEVLDSLHAYHEEVSSESASENSHVILVMDKELQAFPWESLPCLRGQSVSRMSSLGAIWERLNKMRQQSQDSAGYIISASDGAYILNPSSDLEATEKTFRTVFEQQLGGFHAMVKQAPTEKQFETLLQEKSLVLYFGHGGAAQYIRGRTIRKMKQCAVTLLMGCSSAKLTECGSYESYGMPWNYINGGSAAVVGTLWDVTDRDIDRFALEVMSKWGLVDKAEEKVIKAGKRKAGSGQKTRTAAVEACKGEKMSLDQAVGQARDSCLLKYLNGAAPVMYGIPVFLE